MPNKFKLYPEHFEDYVVRLDPIKIFWKVFYIYGMHKSH